MFFDPFLWTDVGQNEDHVLWPVRPLNDAAAITCWYLLPIFSRQIEFVAIVPVTVARFMLSKEVRHVCCWEDCVWRAALNVRTLILAQAEECLISEYDAELVINDDHSLV